MVFFNDKLSDEVLDKIKIYHNDAQQVLSLLILNGIINKSDKTLLFDIYKHQTLIKKLDNVQHPSWYDSHSVNRTDIKYVFEIPKQLLSHVKLFKSQKRENNIYSSFTKICQFVDSHAVLNFSEIIDSDKKNNILAVNFNTVENLQIYAGPDTKLSHIIIKKKGNVILKSDLVKKLNKTHYEIKDLYSRELGMRFLLNIDSEYEFHFYSTTNKQFETDLKLNYMYACYEDRSALEKL